MLYRLASYNTLTRSMYHILSRFSFRFQVEESDLISPLLRNMLASITERGTQATS
jgi:hypothetical protein